jgi:hypothetical protein
MKAVETRPVAVVGGSDGNAVLAGAGDVVLQLIGGGKVRTTLHSTQGSGSPRRSDGGGGMAKSDRGGAVLATGAS